MCTEKRIIAAGEAFANRTVKQGQSTIYRKDPLIMVFGKGIEGSLSCKVADAVKRQLTNPSAAHFVMSDGDDGASGVKEAIRKCIDNGMSGAIDVMAVLAVTESVGDEFKAIERAITDVCGTSVGTRICRVLLLDDMNPDLRAANKDVLRGLTQNAGSGMGTVVLGKRRFSGTVPKKERIQDDYIKIITLTALFYDMFATGGEVRSMGVASLRDCACDYWMDALGSLNEAVNCDSNVFYVNPDKELGSIQDILAEGYSNNIDFDIMKKILRRDVAFSSEKTLEENMRHVYGDGIDFCLSYERKKAEKALEKMSYEIKEKSAQIRSGARGKTIDVSKLIDRLSATVERLNEPVVRTDMSFDDLLEKKSYVKDIYNKYVYPKMCEIEREYMKKGCELIAEIVKNVEKEHNLNISAILKTQQEVVRVCEKHKQDAMLPKLCQTVMSYDKDISEADRYVDNLCAELDRIHIEEDLRTAVQQNTALYINILKKKAEPYCQVSNFDIKGSSFYYIGGSTNLSLFAAPGSGNTAMEHENEFSDMMVCCYSIDPNGYAGLI